MQNITKILLAFTLALLSSALFHAQDSDNADPMPSKTPTVQPDTSADEAVITSESVEVIIEEPFIQADLSILSGNVQRPNGLFWHNGMVYAACNGDWTIYEVNADNGSTITYLWGVRNAHDLYVEDDENGGISLWIPDFQANALVSIRGRSMETVVENLVGPWGITPLENDFLVTDLLDNALLRISRTGEVSRLMEGFRSPAGIVADTEYLYLANNGSARRAIEWVATNQLDNLDNVSAEEVTQPLVSGLQNTTGLVLGADDLLYFAYSLGTRGVIGRIDPLMCIDNGGCTNDQVEIVVYTDLAAPLAGLALSPDMRLYTHTIFSPDIYYVDLLTGENEAAS